MSDELPEEALVPETAPETDEIHKPNPDLLQLMSALAQETIDKNPDEDRFDVVYLTVKSVLRNPAIRPNFGSVIPAIFAYYLDTARVIGREKDPYVKDEVLFNEAALALFDLYTQNINDHTLRRLVDMSARAIHEVFVAKLSRLEDAKLNDLLGRLSNIALITETVNVYIRSSRRVKNVPYISWLKTFFERALKSEDLAFMDEDVDLKLIIPQLTNSATVINVPVTIN